MQYTPDEAIAIALSKHPDCSYADWKPGLNYSFQLTYVIELWRNEECWMNNDPPKYVEEGFLQKRY